VVVVQRRPLFEPQVVAIAVIPIVLEDGDLLVADALDDAPHDRRLAGSGTARNADDERLERSAHAWTLAYIRAAAVLAGRLLPVMAHFRNRL
jgi:hypothetical protein